MSNKEPKHNTAKKPVYKQWCLVAVLVVVLSAIIGIGIIPTRDTGHTDDHAEMKNENATRTFNQIKAHLYDQAQVKYIHSYPQKIGEEYVDYIEDLGEYSVIRADSTQVTDESLADWYFNYVIKNDFSWCMILYTDKNDHSGVYATEGQVKKNVIFKQDEYGNYILGDLTDTTVYYVPTDKGELLSSAAFVEKVKVVVQGAVSSQDESITDVVFRDGDLCVYVDFSKKNPSPLTLEELAFSRTSSITDAILRLIEYDDLWETITVDFGPTGHITNDKENMGIEDYAVWWEIIKAQGRDPDSEKDKLKRYFLHENFVLE